MDETDMIKAFGILEKELGRKYPKELKEKSVPFLIVNCLTKIHKYISLHFYIQ